MKIYAGGCHCGAVQFEVESDLQGAISCNCTHCHKKGFVLVFVPNEKFKLLSGKDNLSEYLFNKKSIRHLFCKTCGTQAYAEGISFPQTAVNARCLTDVDLSGVVVTPYNGKDL